MQPQGRIPDVRGGSQMRGSRKPEAGGWAVLAALLLAVPAAAALPPENAQKLDARLLAVVAAGTTDSLPVWVEFQDKGEDGPAGLARMLADARAALAPRALARRTRGGGRRLSRRRAGRNRRSRVGARRP